MLYVVDADLVLEGIINPPNSSCAVKFWRQVELITQEDSFYITSIGLQKIRAVVKSLVKTQEKIEEIIYSVEANFEVIDVNRQIIMKARQIKSLSIDFESAIESICAEKIMRFGKKIAYQSVAIITAKSENFSFLCLEKSSKLNPKIIEVNDFIKSNEIESLLRNSFENPTKYELDFRCVKEVNYYIKLVQEYGDNDSGYYAERYDVIEKEWLILQKILKYCCDRGKFERDYYEKFKCLYKSISRFCDLYHHQEERFNWLNKLKKLSLQYKQWDDYFYASTRMVWTLVMMNRLNRAKQEIKRIEKRINLIQDPLLLCYFYHCCVTCYVRNKEWILAKEAIDSHFCAYRKLDLKLKINEANWKQEVCERIFKRETINLNRNFTKFMYRKAWHDFQKLGAKNVNNSEKYDRTIIETVEILKESFKYFDTCLNDAISIDWQRGVSYFYSQMANVNLYLAFFHEEAPFEQEKLIDQANKFIKIGLEIAVKNKNYRRIASYYESKSFLEYLQGNKQQSKENSIISKDLCKMTGENNSGICKPAN